jgi:hypothetical protein
MQVAGNVGVGCAVMLEDGLQAGHELGILAIDEQRRSPVPATTFPSTYATASCRSRAARCRAQADGSKANLHGAIMAREAKAEFLGHQIVVRIAVMDNISTKLYIDGVVADSCQALMGRGSIMMGVITESGKTHIVEVRRPLVFTKPRILVDGEELPSS